MYYYSNKPACWLTVIFTFFKVENTIRWRYSKDKDGEEIKESNCRFVRWSDGSLSMHLGNEVFDVFKMKVDGEQNHLFVQQVCFFLLQIFSNLDSSKVKFTKFFPMFLNSSNLLGIFKKNVI